MIYDATAQVPVAHMAKFAAFFVPPVYKEALGELKAAARYVRDVPQPKLCTPIAASFTYEFGVLVIGPPGENICHVGVELDDGTNTTAAALYELARMIWRSNSRIVMTDPMRKYAAQQVRFKLGDDSCLWPRERQVSVGFDDVGMCHVGSHYITGKKDLVFGTFLPTAILSPHELDVFVGI